MVDYLDEVQASADRVNKSLAGLVVTLRDNGIPVIGVTNGTIDSDAELRISDSIGLQVCLEMDFVVTKWNGETMGFYPCKTLFSAIQRIREVF